MYGALFAASFAAAETRYSFMNGADRASPYIGRAGRVASPYVRLPLRPERDRLCKPARPTLDMIQDVLRKATTRAERAAEC